MDAFFEILKDFSEFQKAREKPKKFQEMLDDATRRSSRISGTSKVRGTLPPIEQQKPMSPVASEDRIQPLVDSPITATRLRTKPLGTKERVSTSVSPKRVLKLVEEKLNYYKKEVSRFRKPDAFYEEKISSGKLSKTQKQKYANLLAVRDAIKQLETIQEMNPPTQPRERPEQDQEPEDEQEMSLYAMLESKVTESQKNELKQARRTMLDFRLNDTLSKTVSRWDTVRRLQRPLNREIQDKIRDTQERIKTYQSPMFQGIEVQGRERILPKLKEELEKLKKAQQTFGKVIYNIDRAESGEMEDSRTLQQRDGPSLMRTLLETKATGQSYQSVWKILIRKYFRGSKKEQYLNAVKRKTEYGDNPAMDSEGNRIPVFKGIKLDKKDRKVLLDTYSNGQNGWQILRTILREKDIVLPQKVREPMTDTFERIRSARSEVPKLERDMVELERILESSDPDDDVDYITGADSHRHIQQLLFLTEKTYRNKKDVLPSDRDVQQNKVTQESKDRADDSLQKVGDFYGKLAYIAKYINENLEPSNHIQVSPSILRQNNMSYADLEDSFASLLSERVRTILENPENWQSRRQVQSAREDTSVRRLQEILPRQIWEEYVEETKDTEGMSEDEIIRMKKDWLESKGYDPNLVFGGIGA